MEVTNDLIKVLMLIAFKEGYFNYPHNETPTPNPIVQTPTGEPYVVTRWCDKTIIRYGNQTVTFDEFAVGMSGTVYTVNNNLPRLVFVAKQHYWEYVSRLKPVRGTIERTIDRSGLDRATCTVYKIGNVPVLKVTTEWEQRLIKPDTEYMADFVPHTTIEFLI